MIIVAKKELKSNIKIIIIEGLKLMESHAKKNTAKNARKDSQKSFSVSFANKFTSTIKISMEKNGFNATRMIAKDG